MLSFPIDDKFFKSETIFSERLSSLSMNIAYFFDPLHIDSESTLALDSSLQDQILFRVPNSLI